MSKDYYKILGVTEFESVDNIKSAYRKLARKWHPDIAGDSAEAILRFKEINEALTRKDIINAMTKGFKNYFSHLPTKYL